MTLLFLSEPNAKVVEYSFLFLLVSTLGFCLLTLVNTVRFSIQGMGFSSFAMTAGVLEMAARTIAGIVLAPMFGYIGICLSNVLAWIFADAFLLPRPTLYKRNNGSHLKRKEAENCSIEAIQ